MTSTTKADTDVRAHRGVPRIEEVPWLLLENNLGRDDKDGAFVSDILDGKIATDGSTARTWRRTV